MSRPRLAIAALLVLALAVALRFPALDVLLPSLVEPDAHIAVQVELIEKDDPHPGRTIDWGKYPLLVAWTTIALTPAPIWGSLDPAAPIEEHLALAAAPFVRVRWTVAFLSLLALPATWILARLYLPRGAALTATWLAATSLLAVHFATQGRPHGAAVGFFGFALVSAVLVRRRGDVLAYGIASLACALCFGALQSGVAVYIALGVAHLLAGPLRSARHWKLLIPAAGFALALALLYPFWLFGEGAEGERVALEQGRINQAGHLIIFRAFNGRGLGILARALLSWDPLLAAALVAGFALWLADRARRRPGGLALRDHLVVLGFVVPYASVISLYQRSYERFLLPLLPCLCVLAAWVLWRALRAAAARGAPVRAAAVGAALVALAFPAVPSTCLLAARRAPSTFEVAAAWVAEHVDPATGSCALSMPLILPLYRTPEALATERLPRQRSRGFAWIYYQREALGQARPDPAWNLRWMPLQRLEWRAWLLRWPRQFVYSLHGEWAIIEVFEEGRIDPAGRGLRDALSAHAERVARFSPDRDPQAFDAPLVYQDETGGTVPWMAVRVLGARRMGPVLEVYRLPERPAESRGGDRR